MTYPYAVALRRFSALGLLLGCLVGAPVPVWAVGSISGSVTDGVSPIVGAQVTASATLGGSSGMAVTDGTGSYTIAGLAAGTYAVQAQAEGFATRWFPNAPANSFETVVSVVDGTPTTGIDLALPSEAGGIAGQVRDTLDNPIPFASVSIHLVDGRFVLGVTADGSGNYASGLRLFPESYILRVFAGGFGILWFGNVVERADATPVPVTDNDPGGGTDFALPPGFTISGTITEVGTGTPLAGAAVNVRDQTGGGVITVVTAGDGTYSTGDFIASATYKVEARAAGHIQTLYGGTTDFASATPVTITNADLSGVDIALPLAGSISGTVTDGANAIAGAQVNASPDQAGQGASTFTAQDGTYTLDGLAAGSYRVQVLAEGFGTEWYDDQPSFGTADLVSVNAPDPTIGIDFALTGGAGGITGVVEDEFGNPIPFAHVEIQLPDGDFVMSVNADETGVFTTGHRLTPGEYLVRAATRFGGIGFGTLFFGNVVSRSAATPVTVNGSVLTGSVNFALPVAGGITGQVTDETSLPLANAFVNINDAASNDWVEGGFVTDANGHFDTGRVLAPGTYKVQATRSGYADEWFDDQVDIAFATHVTVLASADTIVNIDLVPASSITGVVTDGTNPIAGAVVSAEPIGSGTFRSAVTAGNGTYTITGLAAGSYRVRAVAGGFVTRWFNDQPTSATATAVAVPAGGTTAGINFALSAGAGGIKGQVTRQSNGTPVANESVGVHLFNGGFVLGLNTDGNGAYDTGHTLAPGLYKVFFGATSGLGSQWFDGVLSFDQAAPVQVDVGVTIQNIDAALFAGGGIAGTVTAQGGGALAGVVIEVYDAVTNDFVTGGFGTMITDVNGAYTTGPVLKAGTYKVRARVAGFLTTFFGGASTFATATSVTVNAGLTADATDIAMPPARTISGTVRDTTVPTPLPLSGVSVDILDAATGALVVGGAGSLITGGSGFFTSGAILPAGTYKVRARRGGFLDRFYADGVDLASATVVDVTFGDAAGIDIQLPPKLVSLTVKDSFDGPGVDRDVWQAPDLDFVRRISGNPGSRVLETFLTRVGSNGNNTLRFADETVNPFASHSMEAKLTVTTLDPFGRQPRARLLVSLFNDGTTDGLPGSLKGDVTAEMAIRHTGTEMQVTLDVSRCDDTACANLFTSIFFDSATFAPGPLGTTHTLAIEWVAPTKVVTFRFDDTPVAVPIPDAFPVMGPPSVATRVIGTRVRGNSGGGAIAATFDDVRLNGALYDDFEAGGLTPARLDPAKWKDLERVREVTGGTLESAIRQFGSIGNNHLQLVDSESIQALQADVTVLEVENTDAFPRARVVGHFYHDGVSGAGEIGDIVAGAEIRHDGTELRGLFFVARCNVADCNTGDTIVFDETTFGPVVLGTPHRLAVAWNPGTQRFTFGFDGVAVSFDPAPFAPVAGPPVSSRKIFGTRVSGIDTPADGAYIRARFDNVVAGHFVSGHVFQGDAVTPIPLPGAAVTAILGGPGGQETAPVFSAADGSYTLTDLPAGTHTVRASVNPTVSVDNVVIPAGGGVLGLNLHVPLVTGTTATALSVPILEIPTAGTSGPQAMGSILVVENVAGALVAGDIVLTLPAGLTFALAPALSVVVSNGLATGAGALESGNMVFRFTITGSSSGTPGKILISDLSVQVGGAVVPGLVATAISGSSGVTPAMVSNAEALSASLTAPTVDALVPGSAGQGADSRVLVVTGANFDPASVVCIGTVNPAAPDKCDEVAGVTVLTAFGSSTQLTATVNVDPGTAPGTYDVHVVNPSGETFTVPDGFTIGSAPVVTGTSRDATQPLSQGRNTQAVTITGLGFLSAPPDIDLEFVNAAATCLSQDAVPVAVPCIRLTPGLSVELIAPGTLAAFVDVAPSAPTGTNWTVRVINPDGGRSALLDPLTACAGSPVPCVRVELPSPADDPGGLAPKSSPSSTPSPTPPQITTLMPNAARTGASILVSGSNFSSTPSSNAVTLAGSNATRVAAAVTAASGTQLTVTVPAGAVDGSVTVAVNGLLSSAVPFTVTDPRLSSVTPASATTGAAGVLFTFRGTKFQDGATVTVNPLLLDAPGAMAATFVDATTLTLVLDVAAGDTVGPRAVTVTNPDQGYSTLLDAVEVKAPSVGELVLSLGGVSVDTYRPEVGPVSLTVGSDGKCTGKVITAFSVPLVATFLSSASPPPAPPVQVTFALTSSALPGTATNEDCEPVLPPGKDFGVGSAQTTAQQAVVGAAGNTYTTTLWSFDWGGTVAIEAIGTLADGTIVRGTLSLPKDSDKDGLPDDFEAERSDTLKKDAGDQNANGVPDGQDRFARDGLSNFEKYRGVYWRGPVKGQTGLMANHERLDPGWRHLFVRGRGFGNDPLLPGGNCGVDPATFAPIPDGALSAANPCPPFEIGGAFAERKVRVMDATGSFTASTELPTRSFANGTSPTLDLATVVYDGKNCNGGEACDQISKIGIRNYQFPTLGFSTFGSSAAFGSVIQVFKRALEAYFRSRPIEHRTNDPARVVLAPDGRPMLAPITLVGDVNDNGLVDRREATVNGELAGDTYIPGSFAKHLSALDVNNDSCTELPLVTDPTLISGTCDPTAAVGTGHPSQATKRQVVRSVATHELGHGVGINIHTTDPADLMYQYSTNWTRASHFSDTAANLIQIHNKGLQ